MVEAEHLVVQPAAVQLGHLLVALHCPLAGLVESHDFFWLIWMEDIHSGVNNALSEDLQYSDPSLEVL